MSTAVQISQVMYRNITGTTKSKQAMKFACSDTVPCKNIVLTNIDLHRTEGTTETYCNSVTGFGFGTINPPADCLTSSDKDYSSPDDMRISHLGESIEDHLVHTEL
uniref:Polygalacturonase n=1 Tax=Chenopodium quinoa TaxID=63459 RepID=A0A803L0L4_CHEQI